MRVAARGVRPDEYILAVLSPEERLHAALRVAREAFKGATLTVEEVEAAVSAKIAAGAVAIRAVPAYALAVGNPARSRVLYAPKT